MNTFSITASLLTHSLAWALLYSLWQGLLIYATLFVLLRAMPEMTARAKHYASFGSLTALFIWFADTWITEYQKLRGITVYITQPGSAAGTVAPLPAVTYATHTITPPHMQASLLHRLLPHIEHYFPVIVLIYSLGLAFMLVRFLLNVAQVRALRTTGLTQPDERWTDFIQGRLPELDIIRPVKLYLSDKINVPMMLGTLKPVILLPIASINHLTTEQAEAILLHELAHIKRHDYLLNILQTTAETILFFNPFVWLISTIIRREREHCCDDMVVGASNNRLSYVKALAILEDARINTNNLAMAATGNKNQLLNRIKRIMEMKKNNMNNSKLTIVVVAIMALTITTAMLTFTPSFAQKSKSKKVTTTKQTKNSYKYKSVTIDSNGKRTVVERNSPPPGEDERNERDNDKKNVDVNVVVNGANGSNGATGGGGSNSYSYSYSFSDDFTGDLEKMIEDVVAATKDVAESMNLKDISREIEKELENARREMDEVDWKNVQKEIERGLEQVEKELENAKVNKKMSVEVKKQMEHAKREMEYAKKEMERAKKEMERSKRVYMSASAGGGRNRSVNVVVNGDDEDVVAVAPTPPVAPVGPTVTPPMPPVPPMPAADDRVENMLDQMEADGLINRNKKFSISKKNDALYINDEKQGAEVTKKYSKYLKGKSVDISGHKNSLSISINN